MKMNHPSKKQVHFRDEDENSVIHVATISNDNSSSSSEPDQADRILFEVQIRSMKTFMKKQNDRNNLFKKSFQTVNQKFKETDNHTKSLEDLVQALSEQRKEENEAIENLKKEATRLKLKHADQMKKNNALTETFKIMKTELDALRLQINTRLNTHPQASGMQRVQEIRRFKCPEAACQVGEFQSRPDLDFHTCRMHGYKRRGLEEWECGKETCAKVFRTKWSVEDHRLKYHKERVQSQSRTRTYVRDDDDHHRGKEKASRRRNMQ